MRHTVRFTVLAILTMSSYFAAAATHETSPAELLRSVGVTGGLVVHVNVGDGRLTGALRLSNAFVVHGIDPGPAQVQTAREYLRHAGLYGSVSVELWQGTRLPYAEDLVNAVIVSRGPATLPDREILRVLAPGGGALIEDDKAPTGWRVLRKPRPDDIDEWTHYLHGPGNNAVARDARVAPPNALQWDAPPKFSRSHEHDTSMPAMVTAGGRVFYIVDEGPPGITDERLDEKWFLIARDAFNGVELWRCPMPEWGWRQWDPERSGGDWSAKDNLRIHLPVTLARRLVAVGDRVFVTLGYQAPVSVIDAATGIILRTCNQSENTQEILFPEGRLLLLVRTATQQRLLCSDPDSGAILWERPASVTYADTTLTSENGRVFVSDGDEVVCLALADGTGVWRAPLATKLRSKYWLYPDISLVVSDGVVLVLQNKKIEARAAATGDLLWSAPGADGYGFRFAPEAYVIRGSVYYFHRPPSPKMKPWPDDNALDLRTGQPTHPILVPPNLITREGHVACYHSRATENYLLLVDAGIDFLDLNGPDHARDIWLKAACRYGFMPANGLLYVTPNQCQCRITRTLHNLNALVRRSGPSPGQAIQDNPLERGPAYDRTHTATAEDPEAWPTFRADARRRGASRSAPPAVLAPAWQVEVGERPVQPVAADGRLFVACREENRLDCLDAETGKQIWQFTTGGRIDSPPTIHRGRVYLGAADGWVYCLSADDGQLAWRFRAAPEERRIVSYGRVESVWPVHGSVLILESENAPAEAYVAAGRSSYLDGGIHLYGLDSATGEVRHHACLSTPPVDVMGSAKGMPEPAALDDVLVTDGTYIFMRNCTFDRQLNLLPQKVLNTIKPPLAQHVASWAGLLDDNAWNRSFWMAADYWPAYIANQSPKAGQLLVFDAATTYSVKCYTKRNVHSPMFFPQTKGYLLMADANDNEPYLYRGRPGDPKPLDWLPPVDPSQRFVYDLPITNGDPRSTGYTRAAPPKWERWLPLRIRAMVKTRDKLFVAGPPDILKPGDTLAAFEGRAGAELLAIDPNTGETLHHYDLPSPPVFDGLIAAYGRLYLATHDGKLTCMAAPKP